MKPVRIWDIHDLTSEEELKLFGANDQYLRLCEELFKINMTVREQKLLFLSGSEQQAIQVIAIFESLLEDIRKDKEIDERDFRYLATQSEQNKSVLQKNKNTPVGKTFNSKLIYPKTIGQARLVKSFNDYDITFAIGPAGTGKTYLSVVYATTLLKQNDIKKIILTRPAVEAGESLGFLPGDLKEKVDPYLRPVYDALYDCLGLEQAQKLMEKEIIEVAPLAYMRGRTLDDALIILDEAQNTTLAQMKMFLTRLGIKSKMIINGDITQIDLKNNQSGLIAAIKILEDIKEINFVYLDSSDVVRHPLVQKIIEAFKEV